MKKAIKIDSNILGDVFMQDSEMLKVFIFFLINANHKGRKFKSLTVDKGSVVISQSNIKKKLTMDIVSFEEKIKKLKSFGFLKFILIEKSFVITVIDYSKYQLNNIIKNKKTLEERKEDFKHEVKLYVEKVSKKVLVSFFSYWTEPNKSGTKMRFELEKTWDTKRRINTWVRNEKNWKNKDSKKPIGLQYHENFKQKEREMFGHVRSSTNMYSIGDIVKKSKK